MKVIFTKFFNFVTKNFQNSFLMANRASEGAARDVFVLNSEDEDELDLPDLIYISDEERKQSDIEAANAETSNSWSIRFRAANFFN